MSALNFFHYTDEVNYEKKVDGIKTLKLLKIEFENFRVYFSWHLTDTDTIKVSFYIFDS